MLYFILITLGMTLGGVRSIFDWRGPTWSPVKGNSLPNIVMSF